ncbi:hypothetical protein Nepgr_019195 [Nepenthes gracilis]|uniref:RRM domain-containing protein n=1 Tax=Nepenthes gracilis TaxID=150966 RepID=A0AAD3XUS6_NEPGR|nr:hypothetical protein Nepgr_019195 [Nepenthes gracilis]
MGGNPNCTVYVGNLDERVTDRVLYDILIQAGRIVDLHIPRDKETNRPKGYAFAEYETEEIADYAVRLFSGLVTLYNRTIKFGISGQDKPLPNLAAVVMPPSSSSFKYGPYHVPNGLDVPQHAMRLPTSCWFPTQPANYERASFPPGGGHEPNGYRPHNDGHNYDYARRSFGVTLDSISRSRLNRYNSSSPISYPSY